MNDRNVDHCVSPMMAINIVSHGMLMQITVQIHAAKALQWGFEPYEHDSFKWRNFRKRVAQALNSDPDKLLAVNWIKTYKDTFPDEWKEIENVALQIRSHTSDSSTV